MADLDKKISEMQNFLIDFENRILSSLPGKNAEQIQAILKDYQVQTETVKEKCNIAQIRREHPQDAGKVNHIATLLQIITVQNAEQLDFAYQERLKFEAELRHRERLAYKR